MEERFYREREIARLPAFLPAATYNLAHTLLARAGKCLSVPIRSLQYMAVLDAEEVHFRRQPEQGLGRTGLAAFPSARTVKYGPAKRIYSRFPSNPTACQASSFVPEAVWGKNGRIKDACPRDVRQGITQASIGRLPNIMATGPIPSGRPTRY